MKWLIYLLPVYLASCMQFRMEEEDFKNAFADVEEVPTSQTIEVDGNHIHFVYLDRGKDRLIVFIHGSPGSWSAFIDYFKNQELLADFDMVSIDRPGFGDSDYGRPEASMERQAAFMKAVISRFLHRNKILVGHSLGGPVVSRIAMDYPNLAKSLVLVAPSIDPEMERYEWYRTWIQSRLGGWLTPTDFWVSNEEILPLQDELTDMLPLWKNITAYTIVLQGKKDMLVPWENAEFARKMLPDSLVEVRYLPEENHFIPWSNPQSIVDAIVDLRR